MSAKTTWLGFCQSLTFVPHSVVPLQFQMASVALEAPLAQERPLKRRMPEKPFRSMMESALSVRAPTFWLKFPFTASVPPPSLMFALLFTAFSAVTRKDPPLTSMTVLLPRAPVAAAWSVPEFTVVAPE